MKLFDKLNDDQPQEEVKLRHPDSGSGKDSSASTSSSAGETRLRSQVQNELEDSKQEKDTSSDDSGSFLPGMSSDAETDTSSKDVTLEDIHEQNEEIISLLRQIKR